MLKPFALERYFARYEFNTEYLLCSSDCESRTIAELLSFEPGSSEKFQQLWLGYTESSGHPGLKNEISKIYMQIKPEDVLVHSGAEEAIFLFMHAFLKAGDEIIVQTPCYQSLLEIPRALGCRVVEWQMSEKLNWELDLEHLKTKISSKTKCIVVNFPHNPTGYLMSREHFGELNQIVQKNGVVLFSDEVYRESEHDISDRLPAACDINESAVSLGVMSKTYGLAGLRIGWVSTRNKKVLARMAELKDYTTICNSAPSEFLARLALRHRKKLVDENLEIIKSNLKTLDGFFVEFEGHVTWSRPRAGSIAFPKLKQRQAEDFCHQLVTKEGVLLLPGMTFGGFANNFRLGFGRKNMPEALDRLAKFLRGL